jgi:hypothetical protein
MSMAMQFALKYQSTTKMSGHAIQSMASGSVTGFPGYFVLPDKPTIWRRKS